MQPPLGNSGFRKSNEGSDFSKNIATEATRRLPYLWTTFTWVGAQECSPLPGSTQLHRHRSCDHEKVPQALAFCGGYSATEPCRGI